MTLDEWCAHAGVETAELSNMLVVDHSTAWRWRKAKVIPGHRHIAEIERVTHGAVTYRDWYYPSARDTE